MKQLAITILILTYLLLSGVMNAQIVSSSAFKNEDTNYPGGVANDPIFYYTNINDAELEAPLGSSYQWYKYSPASKSFVAETGATGSILSTVTEGGYRVEVRQADGSAQDYFCWNFVPQMQIDSVGVPAASCAEVTLLAYHKNKILNYYDHKATHNEIAVDYGYQWSSDPEGPISEKTSMTASIAAPYEDTEYTVTVGSKFVDGIPAITASKSYKAIAVLAKFTHETQGLEDNEAKEGSGRMEVNFTALPEPDDLSLSRGPIVDWQWTYDDVVMDVVDNPIYSFEDARSYPVILTVKGAQCESVSEPVVFKIENLIVAVPNAFTPFSSSGKNDVFRVAYRSVNKFTMLVYNRWGRKVFQTNDPAEGWDGRIGGRKAEPGAYFYKIEATGFKNDEGVVEKKTLNGVIHLIVTTD